MKIKDRKLWVGNLYEIAKNLEFNDGERGIQFVEIATLNDALEKNKWLEKENARLQAIVDELSYAAEEVSK